MKTISVAAPQPHSADTLSDLLERSGIKNASVDFLNLTATGFTKAGIAAIATLAASFRPSLSVASRAASNATLSKFIAGTIIATCRCRTPASLTAADFDQFQKAVDEWFTDQNIVRRHVVPCTIFPHPSKSFAVGPVTFRHLQEFPSEEFGIPRDVFWPKPLPLPRWKHWLRNVWAAIRERPVQIAKPGGMMLDHFIDFAASRQAPWMAFVDVYGRAVDESARTADLATDVALAAIQIVSPGEDMRQLARATGRAAPVWRVDVSQTEPGGLSTNSSNQMPALARHPSMIANHLSGVEPALQSMGRRLEGYVSAASTLPDLNSAWCNAAYWYHEALAETLDTVAVAKLETAIEVLFRSVSMSGSKRRLHESFDAIFGLGSNDFVNDAKTVTVEQFVTAITTARSRILHGTWPTLDNDMPSQAGRLTVRYGDVEVLARMLLLHFSIQLDAYLAAGQTEDTTDAFMSWIKAERIAPQSSAGPTP